MFSIIIMYYDYEFFKVSVKHWVREGKGGETGEMRLERRGPHPQSPLPPSPAVTGVLISNHFFAI